MHIANDRATDAVVEIVDRDQEAIFLAGALVSGVGSHLGGEPSRETIAALIEAAGLRCKPDLRLATDEDLVVLTRSFHSDWEPDGQSRCELEAAREPQATAESGADSSVAPPNEPAYDAQLPIENVGLSVRARNCLGRAHIRTLGELVAMSRADLLAIPNVGRTTLDEIARVISERTGMDPGFNEARMAERRAASIAQRQSRVLQWAEGGMPEHLKASMASADAGRRGADGAPDLVRLVAAAKRDLGLYELALVWLRSELTLAAVGERLGITRERVRQIQERARADLLRICEEETPGLLVRWQGLLAGRAASEEELLGPMGDQEDERLERVLGRELLRRLGARTPLSFDGRLAGWWSLDERTLIDELLAIVDRLPFEVGVLPTIVGKTPEGPYVELLIGKGSPARFLETAGAWVRRRAAYRDGAYVLLLRHGNPTVISAIADALGTSANALGQSLRRDERFVQLRPSGAWALSSWPSDNRTYASTLEAAISVLEENGSLEYSEYERRIIDRYRVSPAAVKQTLASNRVGRWEDGRIDLVERGAPRVEGAAPRQPSEISVDERRGTITFTVDVDQNVLGGSGIPVPPYVTWWSGLSRAPSSREFRTTDGYVIHLRRNLSGSAISALRDVAIALGAVEGCRLRLVLQAESGSASISLACVDHVHDAGTDPPSPGASEGRSDRETGRDDEAAARPVYTSAHFPSGSLRAHAEQALIADGGSLCLDDWADRIRNQGFVHDGHPRNPRQLEASLSALPRQTPVFVRVASREYDLAERRR